MVYVDSSRPEYVEGFTKNTFIAMVEGVHEQVISSGIISEEVWERGIKDLYRTAELGGTFCYTFFKGLAYKWIEAHNKVLNLTAITLRFIAVGELGR